MDAVFIPIKERSERVPGKNFRTLGERPLYQFIIINCLSAACFDDVYVDTNSAKVATYAKEMGCKIIDRDPELATADANGNDLLVRHAEMFPQYSYYFQAFATAPFLLATTIRACVDTLHIRQGIDSVLTAIQRPGWFWCNGQPVNYYPGVLPRSQDAVQVVQETTGFYGIKAAALKRYKCRIGARPEFRMVSEREAFDIDSEEDFALAEKIIAL